MACRGNSCLYLWLWSVIHFNFNKKSTVGLLIRHSASVACVKQEQMPSCTEWSVTLPSPGPPSYILLGFPSNVTMIHLKMPWVTPTTSEVIEIRIKEVFKLIWWMLYVSVRLTLPVDHQLWNQITETRIWDCKVTLKCQNKLRKLNSDRFLAIQKIHQSVITWLLKGKVNKLDYLLLLNLLVVGTFLG